MAGRDLFADQPKGRNLFADSPPEPKTDYNTGLQSVRSGLQGLTFGLSDEVGAATAALGAKLFDGADFGEAYSTIHKQLGEKRDAFSKDNPALSTGLEIAGGVLTGGVGGARALGGQALKNASNAQKIGRIGGVGAAEGGIYGAGSADQGERIEGGLTGAALGGALAPVGAGVVNALGKVGGSVANYAADKLGRTPEGQARQVLRDVADSVGLSADEIADRVAKLGPEGTITDAADGFRVIARAGMERQGTMLEKGKNLVFTRQKTQQARLMNSIESISGKAGDFYRTFKGIVTRRKEESGPLYKEAFDSGIEITDNLSRLMDAPLLKGAFNKGRNWAKSEGDESLINQVHYAKQAIDDDIGKAIRAGEGNKARILMQKKGELLAEIGQQNPKYMEAMEAFADESALKNALELGRDVLKRDPEEIAEILSGMTKGEAELFRLGGVKAISDRFDRVGQNANAVGRIMNQPRIQKQLALVLGDDAGAFLKRAGIEDEFTQTRTALTGNSMTALREQAGKALDNSLDSGLVDAVGSMNPNAIIGNFVKVITRGDASPEVINSLGDMMFKQGMSPAEVKRIFQSPAIRRAFGDEYDQIVAPYVRGSIAPALVAGNSQ